MKMDAKKFSESFLIKEDLDSLLSDYGQFRKYAIKNPEQYSDLRYNINQKQSTLNSWKQFAYRSLYDVVSVFLKRDYKESERREDLVGVIVSLLLDVKERLAKDNRYIYDDNKKFAVLTLMMDIICAYSKNREKIWYSAVIYDIICRMNEKDEEFLQFYGENAKYFVVENTLDILHIFTSLKGAELNSWIRDNSKHINAAFAKNYCNILLQKTGGSEYKANEDYDQKQFPAQLSDINNGGLKQQIKPYKQQHKHNKRSPLGMVLLAVVFVFFIFLIGVNIGKTEVRKKEVRIDELERRIHELESNIDASRKEQDQLEQENKELNETIKQLEEDKEELEAKKKELKKELKKKLIESETGNSGTDKNNDDQAASDTQPGNVPNSKDVREDGMQSGKEPEEGDGREDSKDTI